MNPGETPCVFCQEAAEAAMVAPRTIARGVCASCLMLMFAYENAKIRPVEDLEAINTRIAVEQFLEARAS